MLQLHVRNAELTKFEEVVWPAKRPIPTRTTWERNVAFVKMLLTMGKVLKWVEGPAAALWEHMPQEYYIDGMVVRFVPDWSYWEAGSFRFEKFPRLPEEILKIITAVRLLMLFKGSSIPSQAKGRE